MVMIRNRDVNCECFNPTRKRLFLLLLVLLSAGSLFAQSKPFLIWGIDADTLDFGSKVAGREYTQRVPLRNIGSDTRMLDQWQAACPCLQVSGMPKELPGKSSIPLTIILRTESTDRGYYGSSIYLLSDDPVRPILRLPIKVVWTDEQGGTNPAPPLPPEMFEGRQEGPMMSTPRPGPMDSISREDRENDERERQAKELMTDPRLDSLLHSLPDSLQSVFKDALLNYGRRAFEPTTIDTTHIGSSEETNHDLFTDTNAIWRPGDLTERAFDSISAVLRGEKWVPPEVTESEWKARLQQPLTLQYFHSATCAICLKATKKIEEIALTFGGRVIVKHYLTETDSGLARYITIQQQRKVRGNPFLLTVGDVNFTDYVSLDSLILSINSTLNHNIEEEELPQPPMEILRSKLRSVTFWTLVSAGLLDGINPCAFATLIFFLSMITYVGGKKRDLLIVGICFSTTVFLTYLLMGVGAFGILTRLSTYHFVAQVIFILTAVLLLVLTLLTIRDIWSYLNGAPPSEAILQLPDSYKKRIHAIMRDHVKPGKLALGSIVIGFLVTLFEAVCTGQVYLPTIVMLLKDPELSGQAWLYLVIYNLLFTAPLLLIFFLAYNGVTSKAIGDWSKRNYGWIKFFLLLLFILLLILMSKEIFM